ncbi:MAG: radical SAM protein [Nanoarchaeota archaeon]|nr:radical SAM protein [Nanoarchaeota archaeon]
MKIFDLENLLFVIEEETGRWGFTEKNNQKLKKLQRDLQDKKFEEKKYEGVGIFALNTTTECNLDCIYCSTKRQTRVKTLDFGVGKRVVDLVLELEEKDIVFHGSEPLMDFEVIEKLVRYGRQKEQQSRKRINFSIQTNLSLLPEKVLDFIKKENIGISTSIDGRFKIHNLTRPYKNGNGSYDDVINGINKVLNFQDGISIVTVITKHNVNQLSDMVLDFENKGVTSIQFIPAIPCVDERKFLTTNDELKDSYINLFDQTIQRLKNGKQKIEVKNLSQYLSSFFFVNSIDACRQCSPSREHPLLAVDTNGDVYPCDFFWGEKELVAGNVLKDDLKTIINNQNNLRFRDINKTECVSCTWKKLCGGGCLADSYFSKNSTPYYCKTHKAIYSYLVNKIPEMIEEGLINKILAWVE